MVFKIPNLGACLCALCFLRYLRGENLVTINGKSITVPTYFGTLAVPLVNLNINLVEIAKK